MASFQGIIGTDNRVFSHKTGHFHDKMYFKVSVPVSPLRAADDEELNTPSYLTSGVK